MRMGYMLVAPVLPPLPDTFSTLQWLLAFSFALQVKLMPIRDSRSSKPNPAIL